MHSRWLIPCLLMAASLAACGCGGSSPYAPVSGTVTMDGKPLPDVIVIFQPVAAQGGDAGGVGSSARTDQQGNYVLEAMTRTPRKGALVGKHRVSIGSVREAADQESDAAMDFSGKGLKKDFIPERYNLKSELECEVPPGGLAQADFKLFSKPAAKKK